MTLSSRRHFLRQTSLGAAALYLRDTGVLAAATQVFQARVQDVAATDAASIRKLVSQITGHVITPETVRRAIESPSPVPFPLVV
jgi:hypothetical protein